MFAIKYSRVKKKTQKIWNQSTWSLSLPTFRNRANFSPQLSGKKLIAMFFLLPESGEGEGGSGARRCPGRGGRAHRRRLPAAASEPAGRWMGGARHSDRRRRAGLLSRPQPVRVRSPAAFVVRSRRRRSSPCGSLAAPRPPPPVVDRWRHRFSIPRAAATGPGILAPPPPPVLDSSIPLRRHRTFFFFDARSRGVRSWLAGRGSARVRERRDD